MKPGRGSNIKFQPYAFTEHGAIQAANVLNSPRAIAMGVYVVRAFVRLRDLPEAITQGESIQEALTEAADCLEEAIAARMDDRRDIPEPSAPKRNERAVSVPTSMALKAAVYLAVREAGARGRHQQL